MDAERAEAFLREQCEVELRRAGSGSVGRVRRVARALTAVGALDRVLATQLVRDLDLSLEIRRGHPVRSDRLAVPPRHPGSLPVSGRVVAVGQLIPAGGAGGGIYLLSYAQMAVRG